MPSAHLADADLRTGQVDEHADVAAELLGGGADGAQARGELGGAGVGGVEAHDIDARGEQRLEDVGRVGRGTERGDDPGAAHGLAPLDGSDCHLETTPDDAIPAAEVADGVADVGSGRAAGEWPAGRYSIGLGSRTIWMPSSVRRTVTSSRPRRCTAVRRLP